MYHKQQSAKSMNKHFLNNSTTTYICLSVRQRLTHPQTLLTNW